MKGETITTKEQQIEQDKYDKFKEAEYNSYKSFHRNILNDDGMPKIKKTSFRMPGYRQILSEKDDEMLTINNEKIYDKLYALKN